jgi:hypothetical protein
VSFRRRRRFEIIVYLSIDDVSEENAEVKFNYKINISTPMSKQLTPTSNSCVTMPEGCVRGVWKLRISVVIYRHLSRSTDVTSCRSTILLFSNWFTPSSIVYNLLTLMLIVTTFASDKRFGLVDRVKGAGRELNGRQRAGSLKRQRPHHPRDFHNLMYPNATT